MPGIGCAVSESIERIHSCGLPSAPMTLKMSVRPSGEMNSVAPPKIALKAAKLTDSATKAASDAADKTAAVASDAVEATNTATTKTVEAAKKGLA